MSACSSRFCSIKSHLLFSHILETAYAFAFRWKLENQQQGWGKLCASSGTWGLQRGLKEVFPSGLWPLCCRKGNSECNMCRIWCGYKSSFIELWIFNSPKPWVRFFKWAQMSPSSYLLVEILQWETKIMVGHLWNIGGHGTLSCFFLILIHRIWIFFFVDILWSETKSFRG